MIYKHPLISIEIACALIKTFHPAGLKVNYKVLISHKTGRSRFILKIKGFLVLPPEPLVKQIKLDL